MRMTKIKAAGLKGRNIEQSLEPVVLIHGNWASGKTALTDAIRLGLLGYLPELGKRPGDTFKLASADKMTVTLNLGIDCITRTWTRKAGKVTSEKVLPAWLENDDFPAGLFDAGLFFDMTASERRQSLFAKVAAGVDFNVGVLLEKIRFIARDPAQDKVALEIGKILHESDMARQKDLTPLPVWFDQTIATFRQAQLSADAMVKTLRDGLQTQAQVESMGTEAPARVPDIARMRGELETLLRRQATITAEINAAKANSAARTSAQAIASANKDRSLEVRAVSLKVAALEESIANRKEQARDWWVKLGDADAAVERLTAEVGEVSRELTRLTEEMEKATEGSCCPECGSKNKNWANLRREKYTPLVSGAWAAWDDVNERMSEAQRHGAETRKSFEGAQVADETLRSDKERLAAARQELADIKNETDRHLNAVAQLAALAPAVDFTAQFNELAELNTKAQALREDIKAGEAAQAQAIARLAAVAQREKTKEVLAAAEASAVVYKAAWNVVSSVQADITEKSMGAFMARAGGIIAGVMGRALEFLDGEIGYHIGERWVSHETFCGSEQLLAYAGFALALAAEAPVRILIFDEMGRLPAEGKRRLVESAIAQVAIGALDNFIGCDPQSVDYMEFTNDVLQQIECNGEA